METRQLRPGPGRGRGPPRPPCRDRGAGVRAAARRCGPDRRGPASGTIAGRLRPAAHRSNPMSPAGQQTVPAVTALSDPAAEAAIHAACRILQLPTIRDQAITMADAAAKQRLTHKAVPRRGADRRMRRTRRPPPAPADQRGQVPAHQTAHRLRHHPAARPAAGDPGTPRHRRLDRQRRTPCSARRLRHRQDPSADRVGHRRR